MIMLFVLFAFLFPVLAYDHFNPIPSNTQAIYCIVVVIVSFLITWQIKKRHGNGLSNNKVITAIQSQQLEEVVVNTDRAIKREDYEDFGIAYYIDVVHEGERKTLFMWGQYLDILENFPNTAFTFVRKPGNDEFIDFKITGQYFKEEKTLPAFGKEIWDSGNFPVNGQLLQQAIDTIT